MAERGKWLRENAGWLAVFVALILAIIGVAYWLGGLNQTVSNLNTSTKNLSNQIIGPQGLRDRVTKLETTVEGLKENIDKLDKGVGTLKDSIYKELLPRIQNLTTKLGLESYDVLESRFKTKITNLENALKETKAEMENLAATQAKLTKFFKVLLAELTPSMLLSLDALDNQLKQLEQQRLEPAQAESLQSARTQLDILRNTLNQLLAELEALTRESETSATRAQSS